MDHLNDIHAWLMDTVWGVLTLGIVGSLLAMGVHKLGWWGIRTTTLHVALFHIRPYVRTRALVRVYKNRRQYSSLGAFLIITIGSFFVTFGLWMLLAIAATFYAVSPWSGSVEVTACFSVLLGFFTLMLVRDVFAAGAVFEELIAEDYKWAQNEIKTADNVIAWYEVLAKQGEETDAPDSSPQ